VFAGPETIRYYFRKTLIDSKIKKAEIANQHPRNTQDPEAIDPDLLDQYGNRDEGDQQGRGLADQVPNCIAGQEPSANKFS
jgi:hypothetical protein